MEEEKACALPKHVCTLCYCASSNDHEHGNEKGMREVGYEKGGNDMKGMDEMWDMKWIGWKG